MRIFFPNFFIIFHYINFIIQVFKGGKLNNMVWKAITKPHIIQYMAKLSCSPEAPISWSPVKGSIQAR